MLTANIKLDSPIWTLYDMDIIPSNTDQHKSGHVVSQDVVDGPINDEFQIIEKPLLDLQNQEMS